MNQASFYTLDLWCFNMSAGPVLGNYRKKETLTLKWLLLYLPVKSLKYNSSWKYHVFPMFCKLFLLFINELWKKPKTKLASTEILGWKVCVCEQQHGIGPCLLSVMRPSGGMIHICFISTVNWFQLSIKWEISIRLPERKSEKNVHKPQVKASVC